MGWTANAVELSSRVVGRSWPGAIARGVSRCVAGDLCGSLRSTASAAIVVGLLGAMAVGTYAFDAPSVAARCATTTALTDVLSEQPRPSGPAAEEVCRRLRDHAIAPAELGDVVRTLWTLRFGYDQMIVAGETMNVNVALVPPSLQGVPEPLGARAPRLRWRLVDVRVGDAPAAPLTAAAMDGPLPLFDTSIWQPVAFDATLPPGPVTLRCRVDFELRDGDAPPTRWSRWLEQSVTIVRPDPVGPIARR